MELAKGIPYKSKWLQNHDTKQTIEKQTETEIKAKKLS